MGGDDAGFALEVHTLMPLVREAINTCPEARRYCALKKFVLPPPLEVEKFWGTTTKNLMHSSVAFAICALKELPDAGVEQATLPKQVDISQHISSAPPGTSAPTVASSATSHQQDKRKRPASRRST